jgi:hypothetical protein
MDLVGGVVLLALSAAMVWFALPDERGSTLPSSAIHSWKWCAPSPA